MVIIFSYLKTYHINFCIIISFWKSNVIAHSISEELMKKLCFVKNCIHVMGQLYSYHLFVQLIAKDSSNSESESETESVEVSPNMTCSRAIDGTERTVISGSSDGE